MMKSLFLALVCFSNLSAQAGTVGRVSYGWTFPGDTIGVPDKLEKLLMSGYVKDTTAIKVSFHVETHQPVSYSLFLRGAASRSGASSGGGSGQIITCDGSFTLRTSSPEATKQLLALQGKNLKLPRVTAHFAAVRASDEPFHMMSIDPWLKPGKTTKKVYPYIITYEYYLTIESERDYGDLHLELDTPLGTATCRTDLDRKLHSNLVNNPKENTAAEVATETLVKSGLR